MSCGGIEFKTKGRDDQAECEDVSEQSNNEKQQNNKEQSNNEK